MHQQQPPIRTVFGAILALALASTCLPAQDLNVQRTTYVTVNQGHQAEWETVIKELNALRQKVSGAGSIHVYQTVTGPAGFVIVQYFKDAGQAAAPLGMPSSMKDHAAAYTALVSRRTNVSTVTDRRIAERDPALSLPRVSSPAPVAVITRTTVKPGKMDAFLALQKSDFYPALKSSGVKSYSLFRTRFGGSGGEIVSALGYESTAALGLQNPVMKAMGEEAWRRYQTKRAELVERTEQHIVRHRPDLSYVPGSMQSASGN